MSNERVDGSRIDACAVRALLPSTRLTTGRAYHTPPSHAAPFPFARPALQGVQRLLQPGLEDRACSLVGQLIMELLRHAGPQMVSLEMPPIPPVCCV